MAGTEPLIRNISDTARWVAVYRAQESERADAVFRDPFARGLAGKRGEEIANALQFGKQSAWSFVARTHLYDVFIEQQVAAGVDVVINLAAGLDPRPYRMKLPPALRWVEIDLPEIIDYKGEVLRAESPNCNLQRIRLDLSDVAARRAVFSHLAATAKNVLILAEGLLIYLSPDEVVQLGKDLAACAPFQHWVVDLASPGLLKLLQQKMGKEVAEAGAPYKFGPPEGPAFFERCGWKAVEVRGMLKTAAKLRRLSFFLRLVSLLPESSGPQGARPWGGACLLKKV